MGCAVLLFWLHATECEQRLVNSVQGSLPSYSKAVSMEAGFRSLLFADPHVLGKRRRVWIDVLWSDWGLYKVVAMAHWVHSPELVLVDGDLFDEGSFGDREEFDRAVERLHWILGSREAVTHFINIGNHDIGNMHSVRPERLRDFEEAFGPADRLLCYKNVSFVTYNTQVMGPYTPEHLRAQTLGFLSSQETRDRVAACSGDEHPILMQHMPMHRPNDLVCGVGVDACADASDPSLPSVGPAYCRVTSKGTTYKSREEELHVWMDDVMDHETSRLVATSLRPALVISAHLHAPCRRRLHSLHPPGADQTRPGLRLHSHAAARAPSHPPTDAAPGPESEGGHNPSPSPSEEVPVGLEVTLPTVAWRMRPDAGYAVAHLRRGAAAPHGPAWAGGAMALADHSASPRQGAAKGVVAVIEFCSLPNEHQVMILYVVRPAAPTPPAPPTGALCACVCARVFPA